MRRRACGRREGSQPGWFNDCRRTRSGTRRASGWNTSAERPLSDDFGAFGRGLITLRARWTHTYGEGVFAFATPIGAVMTASSEGRPMDLGGLWGPELIAEADVTDDRELARRGRLSKVLLVLLPLFGYLWWRVLTHDPLGSPRMTPRVVGFIP